MSETTPSPEPGRDDTPPTPEWFDTTPPSSWSSAAPAPASEPAPEPVPEAAPDPAETTALPLPSGGSTMTFPPVASFPPPTSPGPTPPSGSAFGLPAAPEPPAARRRGGRVAELGVVAVLAAALASGGTYALTHSGAGVAPAASGGSPTTRASSTPSAVSVGASQAPVIVGSATAPDWAATAKAVTPSVVSITVQAGQSGGEGSGVIIDSAGHILTNNHVATAGGSGGSITVTLSDGRTYDATVAGTDPSTDLAVLTLKNPPTDLAPIAIADSTAVSVGDPVMAVGNPLGLASTVTTGIVSALSRPVTTQGETDPFGTTVSEPVVTSAIQTSAAINPGNSGGALVDAAGKLIGINSSIATLGSSQSSSGNIGIGFAIPSNEAKAIAEQLIAKGRVSHAYLGVSTRDTVATDGSDRRNAALVTKVVIGSAAEKAGLKSGDAVIAVDGARVDSSLSLVAAIRAMQSGTSATLTILRDGQHLDLPVTLGTRG